jgi:ABC-type sugar transport system ATPase subunit
VALLEMRNIIKNYGATRAVDDVTLSVESGQVHALLGSNGAGKTTLMKILAGAVQASSGQILLDGAAVKFRSTAEGRAHGVVEIFQELTILPELSVAENIFLTREIMLRGTGLLNRAAMNQQTEKALRQIGMQVDVTRRAGDYSIAQQQMFEIARALSWKARILIMDEPTSSLTLGEVRALFDVIRRISASGTAVIYVSHRMKEILEIASFGSILRDGKTVCTTPISPDTDPSMIVQHMTGQSWTSAPLAPREVGHRIALQLEGLTCRNGFHDINLTLCRGEILGIFGLVGSGRTELAHAMFGAKPIESGTIELDGRRFTPRSCRHAVRNGIALVPEDRKTQGILPEMSVAHNATITVMKGLSRLGFIRGDRLLRKYEDLKQRMQLKARGARSKAYTLSGGNQQKLVLAKWMARKSRIFLLDEPTRGVDVEAKRQIHHLIRQLADDGCAVILISSEAEEIIANSDRIAVMCKGKICKEISGSLATDEMLMYFATGSDSAHRRENDND